MKQKILVALTAMALATFGTQALAQAAKAKTGKLSGDMVKVGVMNDMVGLRIQPVDATAW